MEQHVQETSNTFLISTFFMGNTIWGINTLKAQEVIRIVDVTCVHHAPDYIVGIINLRGKIVTIIDLAQKLNLTKLTITPTSRIIIVQWKSEYIGFLVDKVSDVITAQKEKLVPPPSNINGTQGKYFEGVYQDDDQLIALLNVDQILSNKEN
ncbi:MAG: chemotaxis protein CheW [bacterium]